MANSTVPTPEELEQLMHVIEGWEAMQLTNYMQTAGHALIVADYLQTLPDEIQLMWPSGFSLPKVLFFTLRYYVFIHHLFAIYYMELDWASPAKCHAWFIVNCISSGVIILISEVILFVRVYAFSGRNKKLGIYLAIQYIIMHAAGFVLLVIFAKNSVYMQLPIPICMPVDLPHKLSGGAFTVTFSSVLIVMVIMVYIAYNKHKGLNSTLLRVFYRDGVFYFACLSMLAVFNSIMNFAAPLAYKFIVIQLEIDLHVILATRMLLHLRKYSARDQVIIHGDSNSYHLSDFSSASRISAAGGVSTYPTMKFRDQVKVSVQTSTWVASDQDGMF